MLINVDIKVKYTYITQHRYTGNYNKSEKYFYCHRFSIFTEVQCINCI